MNYKTLGKSAEVEVHLDDDDKLELGENIYRVDNQDMCKYYFKYTDEYSRGSGKYNKDINNKTPFKIRENIYK